MGVRARRFRADGEGEGERYKRDAPLGRTQGRMQETSSRGVFLEPSPTYGLLPVYAGESSGKQRNERTDVPSAIFPRTGANKVPAGGGGAATIPPPFPLRAEGTIVRRVNTFVDRENRRAPIPPPVLLLGKMEMGKLWRAAARLNS